PVGGIVLKARRVAASIGHRGLVPIRVESERSNVTERVSHRRAAAGHVVPVRGRVEIRIDRGCDLAYSVVACAGRRSIDVGRLGQSAEGVVCEQRYPPGAVGSGYTPALVVIGRGFRCAIRVARRSGPPLAVVLEAGLAAELIDSRGLLPDAIVDHLA